MSVSCSGMSEIGHSPWLRRLSCGEEAVSARLAQNSIFAAAGEMLWPERFSAEELQELRELLADDCITEAPALHCPRSRE